jgi:hypothetical protein
MKGNIRITSFSVNRPPWRGVNIVIEDEASGERVVEVTLTIEQFGTALANYNADCEFMLDNLDVIGKTREVKTEVVEYPDGIDAADALAPHEVDGWKGRERDLDNFHNRVKGRDAYRVTFVRFVEREG